MNLRKLFLTLSKTVSSKRTVTKDDEIKDVNATDKENTSKSSPKKGNGTERNRMTLSIWRILPFLFVILLIALFAIKIISYVGSISRTPLEDNGFDHSERYADFIKVQGIDISEYQGDINWKKVKSSGADFVFIRAAYRNSSTGELAEDANFRDNIKSAEKSGIMIGAYIFSQAVNADEAEEEADYLVSLVKKYDIDMPLVIDYEIYPGGRLEKAVKEEDLYAASQFNEITTVFCRRVEEAGYESAIYGNYDMLTNYMDASVIDHKYTFWVAQYGGRCSLDADYMFWQAAEDSSIGGISGKVDHDFWYIEPGKVYITEAKGKKNQISIGECTFEFDEDDYELKNHRAIPEVKVKFGDKELKEGKDYALSFVKNTEQGTGYAIVRGIKKYKDWTAVPFKIE